MLVIFLLVIVLAYYFESFCLQFCLPYLTAFFSLLFVWVMSSQILGVNEMNYNAWLVGWYFEQLKQFYYLYSDF